jgi:hypothetical protein
MNPNAPPSPSSYRPSRENSKNKSVLQRDNSVNSISSGNMNRLQRLNTYQSSPLASNGPSLPPAPFSPLLHNDLIDSQEQQPHHQNHHDQQQQQFEFVNSNYKDKENMHFSAVPPNNHPHFQQKSPPPFPGAKRAPSKKLASAATTPPVSFTHLEPASDMDGFDQPPRSGNTDRFYDAVQSPAPFMIQQPYIFDQPGISQYQAYGGPQENKFPMVNGPVPYYQPISLPYQDQQQQAYHDPSMVSINSADSHRTLYPAPSNEYLSSSNELYNPLQRSYTFMSNTAPNSAYASQTDLFNVGNNSQFNSSDTILGSQEKPENFLQNKDSYSPGQVAASSPMDPSFKKRSRCCGCWVRMTTTSKCVLVSFIVILLATIATLIGIYFPRLVFILLQIVVC